MYGINWPQLIAGILMVLAMVYYVVVLYKTKGEDTFDYIFARSSQLTFLVFVLGMALVIIQSIASSMSLTSLLVMGAVVTVVNAVSVFYYQRKSKK